MNSSQRYLAIAKKLVLEKMQDVEASVYLFGSRAKGTATQFSDIDIAVSPKKPLPTVFCSKGAR